jgi:uncharacterized protein
MRRLLDRLSSLVTGRPGLSLVVLVVVSIGLGSFATRLEQSTDFDSFAPGDETSEALAEVRTRFGTGGDALQVLLDAGENGNVLSPDGLAAARRVSATAGDVLGDRAARPDEPMVSFADPITIAMDRVDAGPPDAADPAVITAVAEGTLATPAGSQLAGLLSDDLDTDGASARAGLGIVELSDDLGVDAAVDASLELRGAIRALDLGDVSVGVVGQPLLEDASAELMGDELPRLLGISLLLITIVLAFVFRRVSDVLTGLAGLALALTWTYGIGSLLGPGWLGWTGPFNQITTVVPVLVAGLGIDFALHLTTRQREERAERGPRRASATALVTVGGALVLTTVTTAVGFLTNLASPLAPIRDFGVFTAVGVLSSFVVMIVLVPAARTLLDGRRDTRDDGSGQGDDEDRHARDARGGPLPLVGSVARFSTSHPVVVLSATVIVSGLAVAAGLAVPTTFDTDDFIPGGSEVADSLREVEDRFGADVSERTYALLSGPLERTDAADALAALPGQLDDVEGIRTGAGQALVESPMTLVSELATADPEVASQFEALGWEGDGVADDADVAAVYALATDLAPDRAARVIEPEGDRQLVIISSAAGQDGAEALVEELDERLAPLDRAGVEVQMTGDQLVFARTVDALTGSQLQSIGITVGAAALLLLSYFWLRERSPALGATAMVPTVLVAAWVIGSMWLLGLSFNVLTITIGSLAIAIGVDYGIHIAYRFREEHEQRPTDDAIHHTIEQTGGALAGSAATTAVGFGVLMLSSILPIQQFGIITALTIVYSVVAAVVVMPAILHLWWTRNEH